MRERPSIQDNEILARLRDSYGISGAEIEFLPIGNESSSWVYKASGNDGKDYFLKLKDTAPYPPSALVPRYLKDSGIDQVLAPLPTLNQELWTLADDFTLTLYPFIDGKTGLENGLSDSHWEEFGNVLGRVHSTRLPDELLRHVERETFVPRWAGVAQRRDSLKELDATLRKKSFDDPYQNELATFWKQESALIMRLIARAEELSRVAQNRPFESILCHSDIHPANILLNGEGKMFMVDWDTPIMAPKERDLMFVVGVRSRSYATDARIEELFFNGYGQVDIDPLMLVYYRYEWVVQDIGSYCNRVFSMRSAGADTKRHAVQRVISMFEPGSSIEMANNSEGILPLEYRSLQI